MVAAQRRSASAGARKWGVVGQNNYEHMLTIRRPGPGRNPENTGKA